MRMANKRLLEDNNEVFWDTRRSRVNLQQQVRIRQFLNYGRQSSLPGRLDTRWYARRGKVSYLTYGGIACRRNGAFQEVADYQKTLPPRSSDSEPYIPFQAQKQQLLTRSHSPEKTRLPSSFFYSSAFLFP